MWNLTWMEEKMRMEMVMELWRRLMWTGKNILMWTEAGHGLYSSPAFLSLSSLQVCHCLCVRTAPTNISIITLVWQLNLYYSIAYSMYCRLLSDRGLHMPVVHMPWFIRFIITCWLSFDYGRILLWNPRSSQSYLIAYDNILRIYTLASDWK